jgi:hypothetical protein
MATSLDCSLSTAPHQNQKQPGLPPLADASPDTLVSPLAILMDANADADPDEAPVVFWVACETCFASSRPLNPKGRAIVTEALSKALRI